MDNGIMGDGRSPQQRRHEPSAASTLVLIAVALGVAYGGYRAWSWWQGTLHAPAKAGATSSPTAQPASPVTAGNRNAITAPALQSAPDRAAVFKCVAKGVTTYAASAADCPVRADVTPVAIDPQLNLADGLRDAPAILRAQTRAAEAPSAHAGAATDPLGEKRAQCLAYEEQIKAIDAHARQPLPGQEQDRLAALRKRARDEQFRLRC